MGLELRWVVIDTPAPQRLAPFWEQLLGWRRDAELDDERQVGLVPPESCAGPGGQRGLLLFRSDDPKEGKNRLHIDLVPDGGGNAAWEAEIERALALGARRTDIGQDGTEPWVVLADPEANEFCVLSPRER